MKCKDILGNMDRLQCIVDIIEVLARSDKNPNLYTNEISNELTCNYVYGNRIFSRVSEYTLIRYAKRRKLANSFCEWKNEQIELKQRAKYRGYPRFKENFCKEFEITIEDALKNGYTEDMLQPKLDLNLEEELINRLREEEFISDFDMEYSNVKADFNKKELLLVQLRRESVRPRDNVGMRWITVEKEDELVSLLSKETVPWGKRSNQGDELKKEILEACDKLRKRKLVKEAEETTIALRGCINKELRPIFNEIVEEIVPNIEPQLGNVLISYKVFANVEQMTKCKTLNGLSKTLKLSKDETIELLWNYFVEGFIRIKRC